MGVIVFGLFLCMEFGFNWYFNVFYFDWIIERLRFIGGLRRFGKVFELVFNGLFRGSCKKKVMIFVIKGLVVDSVRLFSLWIY